MEAIVASGQDSQIPELDVTNPFSNQASYVIDRTQTQNTCPTPVLSPTGVRTAKVHISDGNFLDLSTLVFTFDVVNLDGANALRPANAIPSCWFRRMIIKMSGCVIEDISNLDRIEAQIQSFVSTNKRRNWGDAGSGWDTLTDWGTDALPSQIATRGKVCWRPLSSGFLTCGKYLPMMGGSSGLQIELELADLTAACVNHTSKSATWQLEHFNVNCDSVTLTSEFTENFSSLLINGDSILIPFQSNSMDVQYLSAGGGDHTISLAKQFSRLATVIVSLCDNAPAEASADSSVGVYEKEANRFYLGATSSETVESYLSLNNKRYPQFNTIGCRHHFMRLMQGLGILNSVSHSTNISKLGYGDETAVVSRQFCIMHDTELVPNSDASGISVQGGGIIQCTIKNTGAPTKAYITSHFDACLEIRAQGAILYS